MPRFPSPLNSSSRSCFPTCWLAGAYSWNFCVADCTTQDARVSGQRWRTCRANTIPANKVLWSTESEGLWKPKVRFSQCGVQHRNGRKTILCCINMGHNAKEHYHRDTDQRIELVLRWFSQIKVHFPMLAPATFAVDPHKLFGGGKVCESSAANPWTLF